MKKKHVQDRNPSQKERSKERQKERPSREKILKSQYRLSSILFYLSLRPRLKHSSLKSQLDNSIPPVWVKEGQEMVEDSVWQGTEEELLLRIIQAERNYKRLYRKAKEWSLKGLETGDIEPLFCSLARVGPRLLMEPEFMDVVEQWWFDKMVPSSQALWTGEYRSTEEESEKEVRKRAQLEGGIGIRKAAQDKLQILGNGLAYGVSGQHGDLSSEEWAAIAASLRKWEKPVKDLNDDLKKLGKRTAWRSASREQQEDFIGKLAKKNSIPIDELRTVARYLRASSSRRKATPWEALCEIVAEECRMATGTVEKIYQHLQKMKRSNSKQHPTPDH